MLIVEACLLALVALVLFVFVWRDREPRGWVCTACTQGVHDRHDNYITLGCRCTECDE